MLGVDTNVLVRFLADDDDSQSPAARRLLTLASNHPIYVSMLVLAETYTVLTRVKKFPEAQVREAIWMLVSSSDFVVENTEIVISALEDSARANCGVADAMIAAHNAAANCTTTVTLDRHAQRLPAMTAVGDRI